MNKIIKIILPVLIVISVCTVYALNVDDPNKVLNVVKTGEITHGNYTLEVRDTRLEEATSGYLGVLNLSTDEGYYVKNLTVTYNENNLDLGFEAGSEHGGFFRKYNYSPNEKEYQFIIPNDATEDNKVNINIEYAKKRPINISYRNYQKNVYDDDSLANDNNYSAEEMLVENYIDGDIVLPDDCTNNGCVLKLDFLTEEAYNEYKNVRITTNDENRDWISADAVIDNNNLLSGGNDLCFDEDKACYVFVSKDFKNLSYGRINIGYTNMNIFSTNYIGFSVSVDIENFRDILSETGGSEIGFSETKKEANIEIFYGTRKLTLTKKAPRPVIYLEGSVNNSASVRDFDNVTGSGYGYSTSYNNGVATISINTYYQDKLSLELNLLKNGTNILGSKVKINLSRFAFAGNGGELLEVDSIGRNCRENNNGNTCNQGVYYSTQYRGVLSAFYVEENTPRIEMTSTYRIDNISNNTVTLNDLNQEYGYLRNKDFNPHAIALFYDEDDMIVETKTFDLNESVQEEGYVKKDVFANIYKGYNFNINLNKNYVFFDNDHRTSISNIEYFGNHIDSSIMHDLVLIGKEEAKEKGIVKIALFLVNGEIEEDEIPSLTYGIGEGRIMQIRGGEQ